LHDDAFGVDEALNERAFGQGLIVRGKHYMIFGAKTTADPTLEARERFLQNQKTIPAWLFFSDASDVVYDDWRKKYNNIVSMTFIC
jgi:lysosomal alpha-mannosidase